MKAMQSCLVAIFAVAIVAFSAPAFAEDVPYIDGKLWKDSAPILKRTYLVGISNLMSAEYAYQKEYGPPPDDQTVIRRLYEEIDDLTLDGVVDRIDAWYTAHPDKQATTVLEVIWLDMVRPNLPESRRYADDD